MASSKKTKVEDDINKSVKELQDINKSLKKLVSIKDMEKLGRTPEQRRQKRGWEKERENIAKLLGEGKENNALTAAQNTLNSKFKMDERRERAKILKQIWKPKTPHSAITAEAAKKQTNVFTKLQASMKLMSGILKPTGAGGNKQQNPMKNAMMGVMKFAVGGSIVGMLGKKLFDSSPLLKTMMSLFNTSIMLIFRPIGDFIGSFLRPLMLFFMKNIAIPFYKNSKHAMGLGEQYGKQALGFLLKPAETIHAAIITALADAGMAPLLGEETVNKAKDYSGVAHWQLDQIKKAGMDPDNQFDKNIAKHGWTHMKRLIAEVWTGGKQGGNALAQQGITVTGVSTPAQAAFEEEAEKVVDIFKSGNSELVALENLFVDMVQSGEFSKDQVELIADAMRRSVLAGNSIENAFVGILTGLDKLAQEIAQKAKSYYLAKQADDRVGSQNRNMLRGKEIMTAAETFLNQKVDYSKFDHGVPRPTVRTSSGNVVGTASAQREQALEADRQQMEAKAKADYLATLMNPRNAQSYYQRITNSDGSYKSAGEIEGIAKAMGVYSASHLTIGTAGASILRDVNSAMASGSVGFSNDAARLRAQKFEASLKMWNELGINSLGKTTKPQMGDLATGKGSIGYANGGLITEPIFGIGRSGQTYTFGERGQETVTPGKGGTNYILNINVGNVTREADFDKLRPLVQRWILEANSRRGVV